jgi:hypothetical protein
MTAICGFRGLHSNCKLCLPKISDKKVFKLEIGFETLPQKQRPREHLHSRRLLQKTQVMRSQIDTILIGSYRSG